MPADTEMDEDTDAYFLRNEYLDADSDDGFAYEEVAVDDAALSSGDEDLETAQQATSQTQAAIPSSILQPKATTSHHPEVVEDFVRNFLVQMNMTRTAECFQTEWYELAQCGKLSGYETQELPDVYSQNRKLEGNVEDLKQELASYKEAASMSKERYVRLKKERDYHRMHHRRVVQEKDRLLSDIKRMKQHFSTYEPLLQELKKKYEAMTKEKTLACLERDRAVSEVGCLQSTLQSVQQKDTHTPQVDDPLLHTSERKPRTTVKSKLCELPSEPSNPHRHKHPPLCTHLTRTGGMQQSHTFQAHQFAVSSVSLHPTKDVLVTASDDHTWRMWALPSGELLMTGEGHTDWLSTADFNPTGRQVATASGDGTVKIWDFNKGQCVFTFPDHQQPVWGCSWHWSGDYVASGGMDHCCKVWDAHSGQCMVTLRGHADSVNAVRFLPYSNTLSTCSSDKTISIWDARTGLCVQTYYGHQHSCNDITSTLLGHNLFSCDCFGCVFHWDVRANTSQANWDFGPHAVSALTLDPAGAVLGCACGDNMLRIVELATQKEWTLKGHSDGVLDVCINGQANTLVSSASDGQIILWQ